MTTNVKLDQISTGAAVSGCSAWEGYTTDVCTWTPGPHAGVDVLAHVRPLGCPRTGSPSAAQSKPSIHEAVHVRVLGALVRLSSSTSGAHC